MHCKTQWDTYPSERDKGAEEVRYLGRALGAVRDHERHDARRQHQRRGHLVNDGRLPEELPGRRQQRLACNRRRELRYI